MLSLGFVAVVTTAVFLVVAGVHRNDQIAGLRHDGVAVEVTVSGCQGLLGGSGTNPVGYACSGTFTLDGHHYRAGIPGDSLLAPGTRLRMLTIGGDPGPLTTPAALSAEQPSAKVFVLPALLLGAVAATAIVLVWRRGGAQPALRSLPGFGGGRRLGGAAGGV